MPTHADADGANMAASGVLNFSASLFVFAAFLAPVSAAITSCSRVDDCTCKTNDGKKISLWQIDGGSKPSVSGIPDETSSSFTFFWNPCTPFSNGDCKNVLLCQKGVDRNYAAGGKGTTFSVVNGAVVITYPDVTQAGYTRGAKFTLKCDKSVEKANFGDGVLENQGRASSSYTAVIKTKCACPGECSASPKPSSAASGLSIGSILLIIFFPLLLLYCVAGVLFNKYHKGVSGIPEVMPNHSFWTDFPFLVKDGCVFACSAIGQGCRSLCSKIRGESYASI